MDNALSDQEIQKRFLAKQKIVLFDVLREYPKGLSLEDLMIEAKLSENTLLTLISEANIKKTNGVYKI